MVSWLLDHWRKTLRLIHYSSMCYLSKTPWSLADRRSRRTRGGQANSKRWDILFTCLTTGAAHIEVVEELGSSSCINAIRRLYSVRGPAKVFRSDCGTNFIGGSKKHHLLDGAEWIFNRPHAFHMGGVWERMIGIARKILDALMLEVSNKPLTHEVLVTFMAEVCASFHHVNARPLVPVSTDPENPQILNPAMLLTQKMTGVVHLDNVDERDLYRVQWKIVQALVDIFWKRWISEYLSTLQKRIKWMALQRNIEVDDIVFLRENELHRNNWPLALVLRADPGKDGLVRKVELRTCMGGQPQVFARPAAEVILLIECWPSLKPYLRWFFPPSLFTFFLRSGHQFRSTRRDSRLIN